MLIMMYIHIQCSALILSIKFSIEYLYIKRGLINIINYLMKFSKIRKTRRDDSNCFIVELLHLDP